LSEMERDFDNYQNRFPLCVDGGIEVTMVLHGHTSCITS
jgi:hypothetical protein